MDEPIFNFDRPKPPKCKHCGKEKGHHKAVTQECPKGLKSRIGWTMFGPEKFEEKPIKARLKGVV